MSRLTVELPAKVPHDVAVEMGKRSVYCHEKITGCEYDPSLGALVLTCVDDASVDEIKPKVDALIARMKTRQMSVEARVVKQRTGRGPLVLRDAELESFSSGELSKEGIGLVSRGGGFLELVNRLDHLFVRVGRERFGASIREYNTMIPADWLRRAGYFSSFAHSLTFAFHMKEDYDRLEQFAQRHRDGEPLGFESLDELTTPTHCLSPAVCYHVYGGLLEQQLNPQDDGLRVVTSRGRCFRYESKNITDLDRLWEFSMREIVFVGSKEQVLAARNEAMELIWKMVELLEIDAQLQTATDPFFATEFNAMRFFQLANELKFELCLPVREGKSVAAASFNYHETFFGRRFNITDRDGAVVHTGCAAFGLERLALALLAQLGPDELLERLGVIEQKLDNGL